MNRTQVCIYFVIALLTLTESVLASSDKKQIDTSGVYIHRLSTLLESISQSKKIHKSDLDTLVALFREYEQSKNDLITFPKTEADEAAFYRFVDEIVEASSRNPELICPVFQLRFTIKRIAEWAETLSELPSQIALKNTKGFLECYSHLKQDQKEIILGDLIILNEQNKTNDLLKALGKTKDQSLADSKHEIEAYLGNH